MRVRNSICGIKLTNYVKNVEVRKKVEAKNVMLCWLGHLERLLEKRNDETNKNENGGM